MYGGELRGDTGESAELGAPVIFLSHHPHHSLNTSAVPPDQVNLPQDRLLGSVTEPLCGGGICNPTLHLLRANDEPFGTMLSSQL